MPVEVIIEPSSEDFDADDPRWSRQLDELFSLLKTEVDVRRETPTSIEGKKGDPLSVAIILALGSSGAIAAVSRMFSDWLKHGRKRVIKARMKDGDVVREFEVSADGMSAKFVEAVMRKLAK